ncbi:MAG: hypothetical protein U5O39_06780 [Gammaproteobacteria bacterium]|nr:hypothetical protein [Gammaproteobacteria bacterium]
MKGISDIDETRRRVLLYLLTTGAFAALPGCASRGLSGRQAMAMPQEMPPGVSMFLLDGDVTVSGKSATLDSSVEAGDLIETGPNAEVIFVFGKDAFLLRANSRLRIPSSMSSGGTYGLERGKALSALASRHTQISTPSAVISIRGTGVYVEVEPTLSYVCLCYGAANLATADGQADEDLESEHHDAPKYILDDSTARNRIQDAPFKNHDDQELLMIETLVGRSTPYVVPQGLPRTRSRYL